MQDIQPNRPNFAAQKEIIYNFLTRFTSDDNTKYMQILKQVTLRKQIVIDIELDDVAHFDKSEELIHDIERNCLHYISLFSDVIDEVMSSMNIIDDENDIDVMDYRYKRVEELKDPNDILSTNQSFPKDLKRRYEIHFIPCTSSPTLKIRNISASEVGSLLTIQGIITRVTDVRPMMKVATYVCDTCGNEIYQTINRKKFTPIVECPTERCIRNRNKQPLIAQLKGSKFVKFQELKLQEIPEDVPHGNIPRCIDVYCMGETTRQCQCGDKVKIDGIWLPIPYYGGFNKRSTGSLLTANTYIHCLNIVKQKKGYNIKEQDKLLLERVREINEENADIYSQLARSIAPEIYGLEDVKKALLLLLVGGVTREENRKEGGLRIRGDINILLMGDPGVGKSQLLKHISYVAPRCVYTTGKGSSGVGLTAAVIRDSITHDMVLEGGALVLADMGICCIDEFDKMEEGDRTAIHEVMEQQTISIAKAGITTTLNARTSILAAANPAFGRYDKRRSPEMNINLPNALLSRFDLLFVLVDEANKNEDLALARHITHVHQYCKHPELDFTPFKPELIRAYITCARSYHPCIPRSLTDFIVGCYVQMRQQCLDENQQYNSRKIIGTPRALLSILRLSQALAKLRFSDTVVMADVNEAMRLMREAKHSTLQDVDVEREFQDIISSIFRAITAYFKNMKEDQLRISDLKTMLVTRGFDQNQIEETLKSYADDDVWMISVDGETLSMLR